MGLFDWFKNGNARFTRFDDAFALTRPALWRSLGNTVQSPQHANKSIWLVVHFTDTFIELQGELDAWPVDYEVVTKPVDPNQLERSGLLSTNKIKVVLAELIPEVGSADLLKQENDSTIAMIVVERHPRMTCDKKVESFARSLPVRVEYGHFISLDDEVVRLVINDTSIKILKQLGMNEQELIASTMVTRRLNKMLHRIEPTYHSNKPADSAKKWLEFNRPPDEPEK